MTKKDVVIGTTYRAKVSGRSVPVRILEKHEAKGWVGQNLITGKGDSNKNGGKAVANASGNVIRDSMWLTSFRLSWRKEGA